VLAPIAARHAATIEQLSAFHPRGTPDEVWLKTAGDRGWVIVTYDVHIRRRPAERSILEAAGVMAFVLRGNRLDGDQIREALVAALPAICRRARQLAPPAICHITRDGDVRVIVGERRAGIRRT
jgi:PIN like domain